MNKSVELLINDVISGTEYQSIKKDCEEKIERAKAAPQELNEQDSEELDIENLATLAASNLKKLPQFYSEADSDIKRSITGSIFLEKWIFDGENHRTTKMNQAAQLIYHINNKLRHKKTGANFPGKIDSGTVLLGTYLTNSFINDMKKIADIHKFQLIW